MRLGSGDPRLQKERQARLVEPPGGLHGDEDVLQLQFRLGGVVRSFRSRLTVFPAAGAVPRRALRVFHRGWRLLDGAVRRAGCRLVLLSHAEFGEAAGA